MDSPLPQPDASCELLLIEDNPGDARLMEETMEDEIVEGLCTVSDGDAALDFLQRRATKPTDTLPSLILLDWNLPRVDGPELISQLKSSDEYGHIPVIVITGAASDTALSEMYHHGASACIPKPSNPDELANTMRVFKQFWIANAELPQNKT